MNEEHQILIDVPWWKKAAIGALGGLALALLKLIDARFYVDAASNMEVQAAYFTYVAYIVLGSLAAVFISDHDLPPRKIMRSAFVLGLLAPSVLLAIVSQPVRVNTPPKDVVIPRISWMPLAAAHADEPALKALPQMNPLPQMRASPELLKVEFKTLPKSALQPTFSEAFRAAIGRKELSDKYVFVVGATPDKEKALETAALTNEMLGATGSLKSSIIQIEGQPNFYVTVGGFVDQQNAFRIKADSTAQVTKLLAKFTADKTPIGNRAKIAVLLADAPVVTTTALSKQP